MNTNTNIDEFLKDSPLIGFLQRDVVFSVGGKMVKKGKLILFRRAHYFIQFSLQTAKRDHESYDVPIPFDVEYYPEDNLLYFDYRIKSLFVDNLPTLPVKINSAYFNNILEIQLQNQ
jgi:hypothetical protein